MSLIDFCIQTSRLYETYPYHNVVFVGMDADGKPRYANQRGIGSDFIGDANGSDKHYSFGIPAAAASDTLHLFESAVDLLSYGTLQKLDGKDWRSENLLSLAGVYKPRANIEESSLPAALVRYLTEHPPIRHVVLRLDNDATGRIAAETIKTLLPRKYAQLHRAISELPEIQRRRLILYYFQGMTYEQIAGMEGCTKRAVKFSVDIAVEKLKKFFNNF